MKTLLWPLTLPYRIAVGLRNRLYDAGWLRTRRLPTQVISIGNLTVGGTGKTPLVIWTANRVLAQGRRVAVVSRGYRRDSRESRVLVSDGRKLLAGPETAGDEPCVIAQCCPGAVVAVGADRAAVSAWVLERFALDVIVLDDAFQHRAIARDVDMLLIDATDEESLRDLLPAGRLREPMASAHRATAIVVTRAEDPGDVARIVRRLEQALAREPDPVLVRFEAESCVEAVSGTIQPMEWLKGKRVLAFCGIANPRSFEDLVLRYGATLVGTARYRDHHRYTPSDAGALKAEAQRLGAECLLTTEKDLVKVARWFAMNDGLYAVRLAVRVAGGDERLERALGLARAR